MAESAVSLAALMDQVIVVVDRVAVGGGRYNVAQGDAVERTYRGRIERLGASEASPDRATQISDWILFLPHDAVISATSLVRIEDGPFTGTYEVDGPPELARGHARTDHVEARLKYVRG